MVQGLLLKTATAPNSQPLQCIFQVYQEIPSALTWKHPCPAQIGLCSSSSISNFYVNDLQDCREFQA